MTTAKNVMGVEEFLTSGGDRSKFGSYLTSWREGDDGSIKVWLHRTSWAAKNWNHAIPRVVEYRDRETRETELVVRSSRFVCHETEQLLMNRDKRDRRGARVQPPVVCPQCILNEVVMELVETRKLSSIDPLFKWEGDKVDEVSEVLAGGVYNAFGSREVDRDRDLLKELRDARVKRDEAWRQSMLVKMQWQFLVVDDANLDDGLQITFESRTLGDKMKAAITHEIRRNSKDPKKGNPAQNPYPFEWTFDNSKDFAAKYDVLALTAESPSDKVLEIIQGEVPEDFARALEPSSCWELKANLEAHLVRGIDLPWDRIFGPAEKAGLMVPPEDTKSDAGAEDDKPAPEVGRGRQRASAVKQAPAPSIAIGPDHDVWFEDAKPDAAVKGKVVHLEAPEGDEHATPPEPAATSEEIAAAKALLLKWGAVDVGLVVECDHCIGRMTTLDTECPQCGAQYDNGGALMARPCLHKCGGVVPMSGDGPAFICEKCGVVHELAPETPDLFGFARWTAKAPAKPAKEAPAEGGGRRRRLNADPAPAAEPEPAHAGRKRAGGGVPFDKAGK